MGNLAAAEQAYITALEKEADNCSNSMGIGLRRGRSKESIISL